MSVSTPTLPSAKVIHVETRGAVILSEESPDVSLAWHGDVIALDVCANVIIIDARQPRDLSSQLH